MSIAPIPAVSQEIRMYGNIRILKLVTGTTRT